MMIGQRNLRGRLGAMIRLKKLPRFIILVGEEGSGRRTLSKWVAEELQTEFCEVDKGVEAVRGAIAESYKRDKPIVYFFPDVDMMSGAAKSALLKVTEEPPRGIYFIMSTTDAERVLPTLTSRASVYNMDSYSIGEIAEFINDPNEDLKLYANCCNNGREVSLVKQWGAEKFFEFVLKVVDNISEVSACNALKLEEQIAFADEEDKYDPKIFLQAFRAECMRKIMNLTDRAQRGTYVAWIQITSDRLQEMQIRSINKQEVFDMWIFDIREVTRNAEG